MTDPARQLDSARAGGTPRFGLGSSLYPTDDERSGPDTWYARDLGPEIEALAQAGCSLVRIFVSWRAIESQVGRYDDETLERLDEIVAAIGRAGMRVLLCLFADDRHSELTNVTWAAKRDPRTDPYLVERQRMFAQLLATKLRSAKTLFGWQLGNEAFLSGFADAEALEDWVDTLRAAIKDRDPRHPVGFGGDCEMLAHAPGIDARDVAESCDFTVAHATSAYRAFLGAEQAVGGHASYLEAFLARAARRSVPVLLDECGPAVLEASVGEEAAALRVALWSALCHRAAGALARRSRDMTLDHRSPYFADPFEAPVGLCEASGEPKPSYHQLGAFAHALAGLDLSTYALAAERAAILVPAERHESLPGLGGLRAPRSCFRAFVAANHAHIPAAVVDEGGDLDSFRFVVVAGAHALEPETWDSLGTFVQGGGSLVLSYGGGEAPARLRQLFGLDFLGDDGPRATLSCRVAQPGLAGALRSFDVTLAVDAFARVSATTASVAATDQTGNPLVTLNRVGQGSAVFVAAPLERALATDDPWAAPAEASRMLAELYRAVAEGAGCAPHLDCDRPEVEVAVFTGEDDDIAVLINHANRPVAAKVVAAQTVARVEDLHDGSSRNIAADDFPVRMGALGVTVLRLAYGGREEVG